MIFPFVVSFIDKERVLERPQSLNGSELKLNRYISTESPEVITKKRSIDYNFFLELNKLD